MRCIVKKNFLFCFPISFSALECQCELNTPPLTQKGGITHSFFGAICVSFHVHSVQLREDHHLKHGGRMQLGLFLKVLSFNLGVHIMFLSLLLKNFTKGKIWGRSSWCMKGNRVLQITYPCAWAWSPCLHFYEF